MYCTVYVYNCTDVHVQFNLNLLLKGTMSVIDVSYRICFECPMLVMHFNLKRANDLNKLYWVVYLYV